MASLAELEARVAALEADRADYRAVLAAAGVLTERLDGATVKIDAHREAINALSERLDGATVKIEAHREAINALSEKVSEFQAEARDRFDLINRNREEDRADAVASRRSIEDGQAELKDLILQALDRRTDQAPAWRPHPNHAPRGGKATSGRF